MGRHRSNTWTVLSIALVVVGLLLGTASSAAARGGNPGAARIYSGTGLVHSQKGGCLTATRIAFRARVQVQNCNGGQGHRHTWLVRVTAGQIQFKIVHTNDCLYNMGGYAVLLSCYSNLSGWLQIHNYGYYVGVSSGARLLTWFGLGWALRYLTYGTIDAGRQLFHLPALR